MNNKIKVRQYAATICDIFEELLDRHNIMIPDDDRDGYEDEARIYGLTYAELEDNVKEVLVSLISEVQRNPRKEIDEYDY